jgi:hypothetical protein
MGPFSFIIQPLKDIINGIKKPIKEVENIFGEVIHITEDLVNELIGLVNDIEHAFNANTFSAIFIEPFKNAILLALNGLEKLSALIFHYGKEGFEDISESLLGAVHDSYGLVKKGLGNLKAEYVKAVNDMTRTVSLVVNDSTRGIHSAIDKIDQDIVLIQDKIKGMFSVIRAKSSEVKQDFTKFVSLARTDVSHDINLVGDVVVKDGTSLITNVENRFKNENAAMDLLLLIIIGAIISAIVALIFVTKSKFLAVFVFAVAIPVGLSYYFF